jgi:3-phenylpropionate/trans-cinnamate dioxygenase ferredoxin component
MGSEKLLQHWTTRSKALSDQKLIEESNYSFYELASVEEIPEGERIFVEVDGKPIVVLNVSGKFYAIGDVCTHDDGPLGDGQLDGCQIICPRHGARFDIRNGKAVALPAVIDTPWYPTRVVDGKLEIGIPKE